MKPNDFRRIALAMADAVEGSHMDHPDFRVNGRIFATLHPDGEQGMVKLTPDQQHEFIESNPSAFEPASGAWGRQGCTMVRLASVEQSTIGEAMTLAWQNAINGGNVRPARTKRNARRVRRRR